MSLLGGLLVGILISCFYLLIRAQFIFVKQMNWIAEVSRGNDKLIDAGNYDEVRKDGYGYDLIPDFNYMLFDKPWNWNAQSYLTPEAKARIYG